MNSTLKSAQKKRLAELNTAVLPKLRARETLKKHLKNPKDSRFIEAIERKLCSLRNDIILKVINTVPDFLDAIAHSWNNNFTYEDALSYIHENLLESVERYDSTKKPFCKFTSFFWMYNKNLLRNRVKGLRAAKRDSRKTRSLDSMVADWDDNASHSAYDSFIVEEKSYDNYFQGAALRALYEKSTLKQKRILKRLYLGYSQSATAKALGVTGTNINTVIRRMRQELKELM